MNYKMVSDSSSNVLTMDSPHYASVPMKVRGDKEYVDDISLDLADMVEGLKNHKGKSGSACPSVGEWLDAFGDADMIFCTTMSKGLSGSYNSACQAANTYMEENPGKLVVWQQPSLQMKVELSTSLISMPKDVSQESMTKRNASASVAPC